MMSLPAMLRRVLKHFAIAPHLTMPSPELDELHSQKRGG